MITEIDTPLHEGTIVCPWCKHHNIYTARSNNGKCHYCLGPLGVPVDRLVK